MTCTVLVIFFQEHRRAEETYNRQRESENWEKPVIFKVDKDYALDNSVGEKRNRKHSVREIACIKFAAL